MSVDFNSMPRDEPGLGESGTPMFAAVPAWERSRKRGGFGGKARSADPQVAVEPAPVRNAAYVETDDEAFATAPTYATRTVKKSSVAPLAIAAGIVAIGGLAAAGWYATQPHETGMAQLTPGTQVASTPVAPPPELIASAAPTPAEPATAATPATPAKAAAPPARVTTRVAAAAPARARPAATSRSAEDAGVNTSATVPAAPQPYSGTAVAPSAPADIAPAAPVNPTPEAVKPAPAEATPVTPPAAATPPLTTPPSQ
jgi:hypothetical protein